MDDTTFKARIITGLQEVSPDAWNAVANPVGVPMDPFLSWEFLEALESDGKKVLNIFGTKLVSGPVVLCFPRMG